MIAINTKIGQVAWLDARHRTHVHVENDVKQAKALGLDRWPSRHWTINGATRVPHCGTARTPIANTRHRLRRVATNDQVSDENLRNRTTTAEVRDLGTDLAGYTTAITDGLNRHDGWRADFGPSIALQLARIAERHPIGTVVRYRVGELYVIH